MTGYRYMVEASWTEIMGKDKVNVLHSRLPEDFASDETSAMRRSERAFVDLVNDPIKVDPVVTVTEQRVERDSDGHVRSTGGTPTVIHELRQELTA